MPEDLFSEKLACFKQNEKPETVLVIADNLELIKIVIAWNNIEVHCADNLTEFTGTLDDEVWKWLWENTRFNLADLKAKAGSIYLESVFRGKLNPLIGNRVIYPDGTVNSYVQRYLRECVLKLFESRSKRQFKRPN